MNENTLLHAMSTAKGSPMQAGYSLQQQGNNIGMAAGPAISQIEGELNRLQSALDALSDQYSTLDCRLQPIRTYPVGPSTGSANGKEELPMSPIAERIKVARQVVERLSNEVIGTTNALAV